MSMEGIDSWTLLILAGLIILIVVLCYQESKPVPLQRKPFRKRISLRQPLPEKPRWKNSSPAPPLPLSTMYAIRIGREVTAGAGPGDPVWDYDHNQSTGPLY